METKTPFLRQKLGFIVLMTRSQGPDPCIVTLNPFIWYKK